MRLISFDLARLLYHTFDDTFDGDNGYSFRQNGVCKVSASNGIQFQNNETSLMEQLRMEPPSYIERASHYMDSKQTRAAVSIANL